MFSKGAGVYTGPVTITLSCTDPLAVIHFTKDGSDPGTSSEIYSGPISVNSTTVLKARSFREGYLPGSIVTNTYLVNENIDIPIVSIGIKPEYLKNPLMGIYLDDNLGERRDWERPATVEFFEPGGARGFLVNTDLRLFGRSAVRLPEKSFGVFIRPTDGVDGLNYQLFTDSPVAFYQSFVLRSSSDDWRNTLFRDGMIESLIKNNIDVANQNYRPSIVFINGVFMGIHNIRDKINPFFFATHYGVDPANLDLVYVDNDYFPPQVEVKAGDSGSFWAMWNFITKNDMSISGNYMVAGNLLDIDSYIDYCSIQVLSANQSWRHNFKLWKPKDKGEKLKCVVWDLDYGYQFIERDNLTDMGANDPLLKSLLKNKVFSDKFRSRLEFLSQSVFSSGRSLYFIDSLASAIEPYIQRHTDKWRTTLAGIVQDKNDWLQRVEVMRNFARNRQTVHAGFIKNFFGTSSDSEINIGLIPPESGQLIVNGNLYKEPSFSGRFLKNNQLSISVVPDPGSVFEGWQGVLTPSVVLVPKKSEWKYLDNGTDPGQQWNSASFSDGAWKKGSGVFGYGESGLGTIISYGSDANQKYLVTYFRKTLTVANPQQFKTAALQISCDDGAVIYLNGIEVVRHNLPAGGLTNRTLALQSINEESKLEYIYFDLDPGHLTAGSNLLAVEVHQSSAASHDLRFDLALTVNTGGLEPSTEIEVSTNQNQSIEARLKRLRESSLVINEIHYAPSVLQGVESEFIEILNAGKTVLPLKGMRFEGLSFSFPDTAKLDPGQLAVIAKSKSRYSTLDCPVYQWTQGELADGGQTLKILDAAGRVVDLVSYQSVSPWPVGIAGSGYSIELTSPDIDNSFGTNWKKSGSLGGTPGALNAGSYYKDLKINEIYGISNGSGYLGNNDWIEIVNTGQKITDLAGYYLSDDTANPFKYRIPEKYAERTTITPNGYVVFIADGQPETGPCHLPFKISGESGSVLLALKSGGKAITIDRIDYKHLVQGTSYGRFPDASGGFIQFNASSPGKANHQTDRNIIAPARIRSGDMVPIVVRITGNNGEIDKTVNGLINISLSYGTLDSTKISIRNGVGTVTTRIVANRNTELMVSGYPYKRFIEISGTIPEITLSGPIKEPTVLATGTDYLVKSNLEITQAGSLIVQPGVRLRIDNLKTIISRGKIRMEGTLDEPIVIMAGKNSTGWGGIEIIEVDTVSTFRWVLECQGAADKTRWKGHTYTQPVIFGDHTKLSLDQVFMTDNDGKVIYTDYSSVFIDNSVFARCEMGPELRYSHGEYRNSWFMEFPDADRSSLADDNDGIYFWSYDDFKNPHVVENCVINMTEDDGIDLLSAPLILRNSLISNTYEKGISAGYRSQVRVDHTIFAFCNMGVSPSFGSECQVDQSTFYRSGKALYSYEASGTATNCIFSNHSTSYSDDPSMDLWYFDHCISDRDQKLLGEGNLYGNPGLRDPEKWDFRLKSGAASIDKGRPDYPADPDGSLPDLGAIPFGAAEASALVINEIYYNPPQEQGTDEDFEYIELYNPGNQALNLSGWKIESGVSFTFPNGTLALPGEFLLVCSNRFNYKSLDCKVFGWNNGQLSNKTDVITLVNRFGLLIDEVTYTDSIPWSSLADGEGYSLSLKDPYLDNSKPENWTASYVFGGTPGKTNKPPDFSKVKINEISIVEKIATGIPGIYSKSWVEVYNGDHLPVNLTGFSWTDDPANPGKWTVPLELKDPVIIGPRGYAVFGFTGESGVDPRMIGFVPDPSRKRIHLYRSVAGQYIPVDECAYQPWGNAGTFGRYPNGTGNFTGFHDASPEGPNVMGARYFTTVRQMVSGEHLPLVFQVDTLENGIPESVTGNYSIRADGAVLSGSQVKMIKGKGSLTAKVTTDSGHIRIGFEQFNDTLGIDVFTARAMDLKDRTQEFDQVWTANHDYYIPDKIDIPVGRTLTIMPGTRVLMGNKANITINGKLEILGTYANPVMFIPKAWDEPWGGIEIGPAAPEAVIRNCFFVKGGADDGKATGHSGSQALIGSTGGPVTAVDSWFIDNVGKAIYASGAMVSIGNSLISRCDAGIEGYGSRIEADKTAILFLPDEAVTPDPTDEHDGIYLSGKLPAYQEAARITSSLIAAVADDGVDMRSESGSIISGSTFYNALDQGISVTGSRFYGDHLVLENNSKGIAALEAGNAYADHCTFFNNQTALRATTLKPEVGHGHIFVSNSIINQSSLADARIDDGNELVVSYTLSDKTTHPGTGNLTGNPGFAAPVSGDFRLTAGSPAIDRGDPAVNPDPDGTRTDLGAFWFDHNTGAKIIINEIHYKPRSAQGLAEFVELLNFSEDTVDLSGYRFETGITFIFDNGFKALPGEYLVIAKNASMYSGQGYRVLQWSSGDLADAGETVTLVTKDGELVDQVEYGKNSGWTFWPDGNGPSIELIAPNLDNDIPKSWRSSYYINGTPGKPNVPAPVEKIVINEILARNATTYPDETGQFSDWLEFYNFSEHFVNLGGLYLTKSKDNPGLFRIRDDVTDSTFIAPGGFLVFWLDESPARGIRHTGFLIPGAGSFLGLSIKNPNQYSYLDSITYPAISTDISYGRKRDADPEWIRFTKSTPGLPNYSSPDDTTGTGDGIRIYPNPAADWVNLELDKRAGGYLYAGIVDMMGRVVNIWPLSGFPANEGIKLVWPTSHDDLVPDGLYIIVIGTPDQVIYRKILVSH